MKYESGITDDLLNMVFDRFHSHKSYAGLSALLGKDGIKRQLETFDWVGGVYDNDMCIAALWGNNTINLVTRKGYEKTWLNMPILRKFWKWFFSKYEKAIAIPDNGTVIPFLLRLGFKWEDKNKLVLYKNEAVV